MGTHCLHVQPEYGYEAFTPCGKIPAFLCPNLMFLIHSRDMKTRDRILETSLNLFNTEGEAAQSAVDVANEVGLSPGNLYYHFKGKDAIIRGLFDRFEEEMQVILRGSRGAVSGFEDNWVYTYIVLEEIYDFRFFYRNIAELIARYPDLAGRFRAILAEKKLAIQGVLTGLEEDGLLVLDPRLRPVIVDQMLSNMTFWLAGDTIDPRDKTPGLLIHRTVYQIMCLVVPHMGARGLDVMDRMTAFYEDQLSQ